jgi:hypothetical protein
MRRFLYLIQITLGIGFVLSLTAFALQSLGKKNPLTRFDYSEPVYNEKEEFDPSLTRLNSLDKFESYCDSLYKVIYPGGSSKHEQNYTDIVSAVTRKRFYHGYSRYGFGNNYLAVVFSRMTIDGYSAIVVPNDIMKYPFAACSQQSIVMMELLNRKGMRTRKIGFQGKTAGHFCFEVFYNNGWHFYDPNLEPDVAVLNKYERPGIEYLVSHEDVLLTAYQQHEKQKILDVFPTYQYGKENVFPAPKAIIFQRSTKFLSSTGWVALLVAFILVRRRYLRLTRKQHVRNHRIYFPETSAGTPAGYYTGVTASGS